MAKRKASQVTPLKIKVLVPRHNAHRIGSKLGAAIKSVARKQHKRVDVKQPLHDPGSAMSEAMESASQWNSLLITARAERGPQWDIGTQQFHVDMGSKLYYDPTVITESLRSQHPELDAPPQPTDLISQSSVARSPQVHRGGLVSNQFNNPRNMPPFNNSIPPGAFYNNPHDAPMNVPPDMRRSTRASRPMPLPGVGMVDGGFGMGGY